MTGKSDNADDNVQGEELQEDWKMLGHWPIGLRHPLTVNEIVDLTADSLDPRIPPMDPRAKEILRIIIEAERGLNCPVEAKQYGVVVALRDTITFEECHLDSANFSQDDEDMRSPLRQIAEYFAGKFEPGEICLISFTINIDDPKQTGKRMRCEVSGFAI